MLALLQQRAGSFRRLVWFGASLDLSLFFTVITVFATAK
jgi:hypothetical protein